MLLRQHLQSHKDFLSLLLLFVSFRIMAILLFRPGGFIMDYGDYTYYYAWGELGPMGYQPFVNQWSVYPPLFAAILRPIFELSSRIPPWVDPRLFFHTLFGSTLLLFETGNLVLVYCLAQRLEPANHNRSAIHQPPLIYALLFAPVHILLGWFDTVTVFFMLLGLERLLSPGRRQWILSAIALALGFLTKITPLILLPIAIRWLGGKLSWNAACHEWFNPRSPGNLFRPICYVLIFVATVIGVSYPFVRENPALAFSSLTIQQLRFPWQTVWALLEGYYGFGYVWDIRNLGILENGVSQSNLPWGWITLGFAALYLWLYTRPYDWQQPHTPVAFAGVSLLWLFLYNKGWSPQFLLWLLAFIVLLLPNLYGISIALMLTLINFIESYVFLIILPDEHWIMVSTVLLRSLLFVLFAIELLGQIWPIAQRGQQMRRLSQMVTIALMVAILVGIGATTPRMAQAYQARQFAQHPCRTTLEYLDLESEWPNRTIVAPQIEVWRDLYPWLRQDYEFHILDDYSYEDEPTAEVIGRRLDTLTAEGEFWWIVRDDLGDVTENDIFVAAQAYLTTSAGVSELETQQLDACRIARIITLPADSPIGVVQPDSEGGPIYLQGATLAPPQVGNEFHLVLYWQTESPVSESYTVFTQLFDERGEMVAQQDNLPVRGLAPTNSWQPGVVIRDPYRLTLPESLPEILPSYRLWVGLYNGEGRQLFTLADGRMDDHIEFVEGGEEP